MRLTTLCSTVLIGSTVAAAEPETLTYRVVDGHEIKLDIYRTDASGLQPTIFFIHGGALIMGSRLWTQPNHQYFLEKGYNFVSIDYRLAPQVKLPGIIEDIEAAWEWVQAHGRTHGIDITRIALMGQSAGGYLALTGGYRFQPRPRAVVSFYGYGDLVGPWYAEPSEFYVSEFAAVSDAQASEAAGNKVVSVDIDVNGPSQRFPFYLYARQRGEWPQLVSGRSPSDKEWFAAYEPLRNVDGHYPPTILLHGEADTDVPYEQSQLMAAAFAEHGVVHEFVSEPDWGHGFDFQLGLEDESVAAAFASIERFLERHLL